MRLLPVSILAISLSAFSHGIAQPPSSSGCRFVTQNTGGVQGQIIDKQANPITDVRVAVFRGVNIISFSDSDLKGHFRVGCIPPGQYQLKIFKDGYLPIVIGKITIKSGQWFFPCAGFWIPPCGNDYRLGMRLASTHDHYNSDIGHATVLSREELDTLPLSR